MAGKGLNDLGLKNEAMPQQSYDELPEFGGFTPPPQPGAYRWKLPQDLSRVWETFDVEKGQRIRAIFDRDAPLTIIQSPGAKANGDTFQTRISNAERKRGKDGPEASDMDYLLKALGEKVRPTTNQQYAQKLIANAGREFGSDLRYTWFCNDKKNIWAYQGEGEASQLKEVEGQQGCGRRYYQADQTKKLEQQIQKDEHGEYPHEIICSCGAAVRCFASLDNFRA